MAQAIERIIDKTKTWSGLPAPQDWHIVGPVHHYPDGDVMGNVWERLTGHNLSVIEDVEVKDDGKRWLHISVARRNNKIPTYEDLHVARKLFIGEHRECYMVFPTEERYVNIDNVLHLWSCLDEPNGVLPHFEKMMNGRLSI